MLATTATAQRTSAQHARSNATSRRAASDVTGWNKIQWGMTVAQAKRRFGADAAEPGDEYKGSVGTRYPVRLIINNLDIGGLPCTATIETDRDTDSIASVTLKPGKAFQEHPQLRTSAFDQLKELLIQKYGKPKIDDVRQENGNVNSKILWSFPSTIIELYRSEGSYDLGYVLLTYHAVDKKALNAL